MTAVRSRWERTRAPLAVCLVVAMAACGQGAPAEDLPPAEVVAIRATSDRWLAAARAGDWDAVAATFTEDAILRFPDATYEGRAAILKFFQTQQPYPANRTLHIEEIRGRGDMAYVMGHSAMTPEGGGPPVIVSRYLDIRLRQADGTWLFYRDVVTPVAPPPAS